MAKFMVLYRSPVSAEEQMASATPEQAQAGLEAWNAWGAKAGDALVDFGTPVSQAGVVGAGSSPSGAGYIGGFSVLEADSVDSLRSLLDDHPHLMLEGATIEILEYLPTPGM
jgi:hypothetical protein